MSRRKNRIKNQSSRLNDETTRFYYEYLKQISMAIYKWEGLPVEIDERFLALTLFERGLALFYWDDDYQHYFVTQASISGKPNINYNPVMFKSYGPGGFNKDLWAAECVPIWANYLRRPDHFAISLYARRLADIDRTIDVNLANLKLPLIVQIPESARLNYKNLLGQVYRNEPAIVTDEQTFAQLHDSIGYFDPGVPNHVNELQQAKITIWSEIMTYLGIDNTNIMKAERVQTAEVQANNGQIEASRLTRLNTMRMACKEINRKYGLEVWVDYNRDISSDLYASLIGVESNNQERGDM